MIQKHLALVGLHSVNFSPRQQDLNATFFLFCYSSLPLNNMPQNAFIHHHPQTTFFSFEVILHTFGIACELCLAKGQKNGSQRMVTIKAQWISQRFN